MNGYFLIVLSQIMLGSVAVFGRWSEMPAEIIVLFRCLFGALSIGIYVLFKDTIKPYLKLNKTLFLLIATGVFMAANWLFFFKAVLTTSIANTILLYNLAPIFVLGSAVIFLKERPTSRQLVCILVAFVGVACIMSARNSSMDGTVLQGGTYAIIAGALYSQVTIIGRFLKNVPAAVITFFQTTVGALLLLPLSVGSLTAVTFQPMTWVILVSMGILHTSIPYLMYFKGLKTVNATVAGILQYIYTLSTIAFGVVFFREGVSVETLIGGSAILISSYVAIKFPGRRRETIKA
jgi:drug/metabolite transporter (DMT)-like permease